MKRIGIILLIVAILSSISVAWCVVAPPVLVFSSSGAVSVKASLASALTSADTAGKEIAVVLPSTPVSTALALSGGRTLTFKGNGTIAFSGSGALTGLPESRPEMFVGNTALAKAIAASNLIRLSDAVYTPSANLTLTGKVLKGVPRKSIIRPLAGVTVALTVNASSTVDGVVLDGTNTTGAKGFYVASNAVDDDIAITNCQILNFTGTDAVGMHFNAAVNTFCEFLLVNNNYRGMLFDNASNSLPTTVVVSHSQIANSDLEGVLIRTGQLLSFPYTIFQSNGWEGLKVLPSGFTAFDINVDHAWFENNQTAVGAGRTSAYSMYVDGTNSGAVPVRVSVKDTHFGVGTTTERALYINAAYYTLRDLEISIGDREQITIGAGASGSYYGVPSATNPDLMINDLSKLMSHDSKWVAWAPTVASDAGNSAATFVSAPTVTARYKLLGKTLHVNVKVVGTLKAVTPTYISFTMPTGLTVVGSTLTGASLISGGTYSGALVSAVTTTIYLQKVDNSALTSGAAITMQGASTFEVSY